MSIRRRVTSDRGAVAIQAALAMVVLFGFTAFVIDYGILWLSRAQAQTAADAGAMAGAIAQAYDGAGTVSESATKMVAANQVWFASAASEVLPEACPTDASGSDCIRVNVYRDGTAGSTPLPTVFGPVLSIANQGVRATATAQVAVGNGASCMKPLAIPDRWVEHRPVDKPWEPGDVFSRYNETGGRGGGRGALLVPADQYAAPSPADQGTGMSLPVDLGEALSLYFSYALANDPIEQGMALPLNLPGPNSYEANLTGCNGQVSAIGTYVNTDGGASEGDTSDGIADLMAADPGAYWDLSTQRVEGSCAPGCARISPRLIALAVFDVDDYQQRRATNSWCGGSRCVRIVNIVGFFIHNAGAGSAVGYLTKYPGMLSSSGSSLLPVSSFLPAVTLVR